MQVPQKAKRTHSAGTRLTRSGHEAVQASHYDEVLRKELIVPLTERQKMILKWVCKYVEKNSFYPTQREVEEGFGMKQASAWQQVNALVKKGLLPNHAGREISASRRSPSMQ
jgi:hypothetical protein